MEVRAFGIGVSLIESGDFATSFAANRRMTRRALPPRLLRIGGARHRHHGSRRAGQSGLDSRGESR